MDDVKITDADREAAPMLTDQQRAEGWVEHDGGPCPVDPEIICDVMFADGEIFDGGGLAGLWVWEADAFGPQSSWLRIIAYRKEPQP